MIKVIGIALLAILLLFSCQNNESQSASKETKWNYVAIHFKDTTVIVSSFDNILHLRKDMHGIDLVDKQAVNIPNEIIEKTIRIKSKDRDSIYKWAKQLVEQPPHPKAFCTDYVGKLFVEIEVNEQVTKSCKYNSICEWSTFSNETAKLNALFEQILKKH